MSRNVLDAIKIYCNTWHRLYEMAQWGDGKVTYHREIFATYTVENDFPLFKFQPTKYINEDLVKNFEKKQFFFRPLLIANPESSHWLFPAEHIAHDLQKVLTLDEALGIKFIRDKHQGNWDAVSWQEKEQARDKIKLSLKNFAKTYHSPDLTKHLEHFALCAIYDI